MECIVWPMIRLNSGNKNCHNFFIQANFKYLNIGSDSVDHDESGDTKVFVQFRGNSILKISLRFWNYVGCGHMRGCFILKITQCVYLITLVTCTSVYIYVHPSTSLYINVHQCILMYIHKQGFAFRSWNNKLHIMPITCIIWNQWQRNVSNSE